MWNRLYPHTKPQFIILATQSISAAGANSKWHSPYSATDEATDVKVSATHAPRDHLATGSSLTLYARRANNQVASETCWVMCSFKKLTNN